MLYLKFILILAILFFLQFAPIIYMEKEMDVKRKKFFLMKENGVNIYLKKRYLKLKHFIWVYIFTALIGGLIVAFFY